MVFFSLRIFVYSAELCWYVYLDIAVLVTDIIGFFASMN